MGWGLAVGGTFGGALPYLLGDWSLRPLTPGRVVCEVAGGFLIVVGLLPIAGSFVEFVRAHGSPIPLASPPCLVVRGFYRYVRNPIYVGFLVVLLGQTVLFASLALLEYTAAAFCIGATVVHFYEQPTLARRFGEDYSAYKASVRAWAPRLHPWRRCSHEGDWERTTTPSEPPEPAETNAERD